MKKIGFIDFYLSEWHSNAYLGFIKRTTSEMEPVYAWAEREVSPVDGRKTDEWCEAYGVKRCSDIDELCRESDCIVILAPDDAERHLPYAKEALRWGKRTFIDKTFAPDAATAKEIFDLAREYRAPLFSSSSLRYATELSQLPYTGFAEVKGSGVTPEIYTVHHSEMLVTLLGLGAKSALAERMGNEYTVHISYEDSRKGIITYIDKGNTPWMARTSPDAPLTEIRSDFFGNMFKSAITPFFLDGTVAVSEEQTMEVMRLRDAVIAAMAEPGRTVALQKL